MEIEVLKLGDITPYDKNPRKNDASVDKVAASIKAFGFKVPIVIDKNNVVVCGHTRLKAAKKLKMDEVPCIRADDLTEEQIKAYRLADNKVGEDSQWDLDLLDEELGDIFEIDMEEFGFDLSIPDDDAVDDDYEVEPPEEPKSERGQIYQLGDHRVMCGDATNPDDVKKLCGGELCDLYLTDPPYNVDYTGKTKDALKIENDKKSAGEFKQFLTESFFAAKENLKAGASFYIWHADSEGYNFRGACVDNGWTVRECLIWVKNTMVLGRQDYQWQHEPCLYGWNDGSHSWYSDRKQTTVLKFDKPARNGEHPTMKPIPLFDYLIKNSSKEGDIVLDSFGGSGTTIMACEQNGRKGYCMEIDPKYVDVIIDRWEKFTGRKAVLINGEDRATEEGN